MRTLRIPELSDDVLDRFWSRVGPPDEHGCLPWIAGKTSEGYGTIRIGGVSVYAHRLAWVIANGPIPDGLVVDHVVCHRKDCVNAAHLRVCTQGENVTAPDGGGTRMANTHRSKTHCPQGHRYDEENTRIYRGRRYCRACQRARARGKSKE